MQGFASTAPGDGALHGLSLALRKYLAKVHVTESAKELDISSAGVEGAFGAFSLTWLCFAKIM